MNEDRPFSVYIHTSPNGKVYIGITKRKPEERWQNGRGYTQNIPFTNDIDRYGWDNIKHEVIADNLSVGEACILESQLIREYDACNPDNGYNHADGGRYKYVHYSDSGIEDKLLQLKIQMDAASSHPILEMCQGLAKMKQKKLYRSFGFGTFEEYCEEALGMSRSHAYRYIQIAYGISAESAAQLAHIGMTKLALMASVTEEQRTQIIESVDIENISVKQLQAKIDDFNNNV